VESKVAIVTGGSRGIGRACVDALLEAGWVVELSSLRPESARAAQAELAATYGERVAATAVDVREADQVEAWVEDVRKRRGRLDLLVNNAGLGRFGSILDLSRDEWREVIETNLDGAYFALAAAARIMVADGTHGWIINIASLASKNPFAGGAAYNASKFGLLGLSEAAMLDLRPHGIRVVAVLPGSVDTGFAHRGSGDRSWMIAPEDLGRLVLDLLATPERTLPSLIEVRPTFPQKR
jgi:NAD(P)-dependent dehydrogenase (short-subunit alcohol dehydrogenase family)